jgi:low temperature requirement protein LtrA
MFAIRELFVDLLLVAAASAMADTFLEDQSYHGFYEFVLLYMAIINGWFLYTHHYTSRFRESSLTHTLVLFFYLLGMAITVVNASYKTAAPFSMGVIIQRTTWICMMVPVGLHLPRAKDFAFVFCWTQVVYLLPHLFVTVYPASAVQGWTVAFLIDFLTLPIVAFTLPVSKLIPINIEHTKDRLGVLVRALNFCHIKPLAEVSHRILLYTMLLY